HAIECRINAEDASKNFAPAPGSIGAYSEPTGPGVRIDSGVGPGGVVSPMYDPMVAKLIVWDADREQATARMLRALGEFEITELKTLIPFHKALLASDQWAAAETCRDLVEDKKWLKQLAFPKVEPSDSEEEEPKIERDYSVEVSGKRFEVKVIGAVLAGGGAAASNGGGRGAPKRRERSSGGAASSEELPSPLQGTVLKVAVEQGAEVEEGALICVIEAMKMENEITAHRSGKVEELTVTEGASVAAGEKIAKIV
nr:carbamoyl phosphate synthase [Thermoleophilaceae bacterium]